MKKNLLLNLFLGVFLCAQVFSQTNRFYLGEKELIDKTSSFETKNAFDVAVLKARSFELSEEFFVRGAIQAGDKLELNLFSGSSFESTISWVKTDVNHTTTYVAQLEGHDYSFGVISINGNDILVTVDIPPIGQKFATRYHPVDSSLHLVMLDTSNLDVLEGGHPEVEKSDPDKTPPGLESNTNRFFKFDGRDGFLDNELYLQDAEIDVLVAYTPNAETWANSNEGNINNTIANAMAWCNIASSLSELGITFNLAHSQVVYYNESGDSGTDLGRLRNPYDGHMDVIHQWRNTYNADMISLLTQVDDVGGMGYLLRNIQGDISTGYSLTRVQQASYTYTMIHEIGHNMGAHHHANQNFQPGPTYWTNWPQNLWSAGWYWQNDQGNYFCDLMTYSSGQYFNDLPNYLQMGRVPVFSSPRIFHQENPTGQPVMGDNARTLIQVKHYVSKYRDEITSQYCLAQGGSQLYYISNVSLGGQVQESGNLPYYDFSFHKPEVIIGEALEVVVTITGADPNNQLLAWVDWDDNKNFDPESEIIFSEQSGNQQFTFHITPPENTEPGPKRLRIRLNNTLASANPNSTPCGNNSFGEVQDFNINVLPQGCVPIEITDNPASSTICQISGSASLQISATGSDELAYNWQYLKNGTWETVQNGIPAGAQYEGFNTNSLGVSNIGKVGQHYFRCIVSNCGGAISKISQNVAIKTVEVIEQPSGIYGNAQPCQGQTVLFFVDPIDGAALQWDVPSCWQVVEDNSNHNLFVEIGHSSGDISVTATNECGTSEPSTLTVNVTPKPPTPTLSLIEGNILESGAPEGNNWYRDNVLIYGASGQTYTVTEVGSYHVKIILAGCVSENSNIVNVTTVSINHPELADEITVFPNPVKDQLFIEISCQHETASYLIVDLAGQVVDTSSFIKQANINTGNLPSGVYFVKVRTLRGIKTKKFIKY